MNISVILRERIGLLAGHAMDLPYDFNTFDVGMAAEAAKQNRLWYGRSLWKKCTCPGCGLYKPVFPMGNNGQDTAVMTLPVRIFDTQTRTAFLDRSELMALWDDLRFYED